MRTKKGYGLLLLGIIMIMSVFFTLGCEAEKKSSMGDITEYSGKILDVKYSNRNLRYCTVSLVFEDSRGKKNIGEYSAKNEDICKSAKIGTESKVYAIEGKKIKLIEILGDDE